MEITATIKNICMILFLIWSKLKEEINEGI